MSRKQEATPCSVIKTVARSLECDELTAFKIVSDQTELLERGIRLGSFTGYVASEIIQALRDAKEREITEKVFRTAAGIFDYALEQWVPMVRDAGFGGFARGMEKEFKRLRGNVNRSGTYPTRDLCNYLGEHVLSFLHSSRGGEEAADAILADMKRFNLLDF
jgi:hypothetical protein